MLQTIEPQYASHFDTEPVTLGPMTGATWRRDPTRLARLLEHCKFVAEAFKGFDRVAEIGCSDGFAAPLVKRNVGKLDLYDMDVAWAPYATQSGCDFRVHDIVKSGPLTARKTIEAYDGIYALDVLEHIRPEDEPEALMNIRASLMPDGVFIAGCPSLESQVYASDLSKAGHVNCKSAEMMRSYLQKYFRQVFRFSMNDCTLHTGFGPMSHYILCICVN